MCVSRISSLKFTSHKYSMADVLTVLPQGRKRRRARKWLTFIRIVRHMQGVYVVRGLAAGSVGSAGSPFGPTV